MLVREYVTQYLQTRQYLARPKRECKNQLIVGTGLERVRWTIGYCNKVHQKVWLHISFLIFYGSLIGYIILVLWLVTKILFQAEVVLYSQSEYQRIGETVSFWWTSLIPTSMVGVVNPGYRHEGINGACLLKTGSRNEAEESWTGSPSQTSDKCSGWKRSWSGYWCFSQWCR